MTDEGRPVEIESDPFSTHLVPLISAVLQTVGPVVEMGMGHYSTPVLHELCHDRFLVSVDNDEQWFKQFEYLRRREHAMMYAADPDDWTACDSVIETLGLGKLGVLFIDNGGDVANRAKSIKRWGPHAVFTVIHDSNVVDSAGISKYGLDEIRADFKYSYEYEPYVLHTLVLSNDRQFSPRSNHGGLVR